MIKGKSKVIFTLLLLFATTIFIINPNSCMQSCLNGLKIWLLNVVPALFPFFIFTRIIIALNQTSIPALDKITYKCFHTQNSGLIYCLSLLSGYPVGAKLISNYYDAGAIDKKTASKMFSYCSTSGPMFIVGAIGIGVFRSAKVGYILLIGHIIGSFLNGMIYRGKGTIATNAKPQITKTTINEIMYDSIISILLVGGYIVFASVLIQLLQLTGILPWLANSISSLIKCDYSAVYSVLSGVLEITNGLIGLGGCNISIPIKIIISSILIAFSGICIMLQSTAFLSKLEMSKRTMFKQKISQALLSGLATAIIVLIVY